MSHPVSHTSSESQGAAFDNTSKMAAIIIGVIAAIAGIATGAINPFLRHAASTQGLLINALFSVLIGIATAVFVIVQGFLIYAIVRFARAPEDEGDGPAVRGNTRLEMVWTAIPALIVVGISVLSYRVLVDIDRPTADQLKIEVTGRQFSWEFYYPDYDLKTNELHAPLGRQINLRLTSADVNHAFWVPEMRIKKDAMGGKVTDVNITPTRLGSYRIVCAEYLRRRAQQDDRAIRRRIRPGVSDVGAGTGGRQAAPGQRRGRRSGGLRAATVQPVRVRLLPQAGRCRRRGDPGPGLDGLGSRAGSVVPGESAEQYILNAITKPNAYVTPGFQPVMPGDYGQRMSKQEIDALVKYLLGQK